MTVRQQTPAARAHVAGWVWGLGATLCVVVVLASAYVGHHLVLSHGQAAAHLSPPATSPAAVLREVRPEAGAAYAVPIGTTARMVLVASGTERTCPPVGACGPAPALDHLEVVDVASGTVLASRALDGLGQDVLSVAVDAPGEVIALVTPHEIATYSATSLDPSAALPLPAGAIAGQTTGAAVDAHGTLWLTVRRDGQVALLGLDDRTGQTRADAPLAGAASADGPLYDARTGEIVMLTHSGGGGDQLVTFSPSSGLQPRPTALVPGARLGPVEPTTGDVYLFGPDGTTYRVDLASAPAAAPATVPALFGARALGWDTSGGQQIVADNAGIRLLDTRTGQARAVLPLAVQSPPEQALVAVHAGGKDELALLAEHGTLVVLQAAPADGSQVTADTAVLLARAALVQLVPQDVGNPSPQDPRFLTADVFTPGPGARNDVPFMVRDPDVGWQSATPGTASISVASALETYDVTFTVTWTQHHFTHRHTTVLRVSYNGAVALVSDSGDGLP